MLFRSGLCTPGQAGTDGGFKKNWNKKTGMSACLVCTGSKGGSKDGLGLERSGEEQSERAQF